MAAEPAPKPRWYRGRLTSRWEVSSFQPEDGKERWWASFEGLNEKSRKRLPLPGVAAGVEVRLYGATTDSGAYGHMGLYDREFKVTNIGAVTRPSETTEEKS